MSSLATIEKRVSRAGPLGRRGNGDVEVELSRAEDLPCVMGLVGQAFDNRWGLGLGLRRPLDQSREVYYGVVLQVRQKNFYVVFIRHS